MDIEQLKLVLETLQSVSHDASSLAILWLWLKFGAAVASNVAWMAVVLFVAWLIGRAILQASGVSGSDLFIKEMRGLLNTGVDGVLTDNERERTQLLLRKIATEYVQQKAQSQ